MCACLQPKPAYVEAWNMKKMSKDEQHLCFIDKHSCLKYCIFTKHSQIVCLTCVHILVCPYAQFDCRLWKFLEFNCVFCKLSYTVSTRFCPNSILSDWIPKTKCLWYLIIIRYQNIIILVILDRKESI